LPWTTTKRGLNRESQIYQQTLNRMNLAARPVMNFLDRMYVTAEEAESPYERELAKDVQQAKFAELTEPRTFSVPAKHPSTKKKVTVQYLVEREKLDLLKRTLKKPDWSARQIGLYALNYLIQRECGE
jgi:hypothetical protein